MHKLDSIAENVRECQKCELCETRIKAVPGKGNFDADVITHTVSNESKMLNFAKRRA